jgi:hypothetical protein
MKEEIKLFLFVLSVLFSLTYLINFIFKLFQENPEPMEISKVDRTLLYITVSYIITYFLI